MEDPGCMNCLGTNCIPALASCVGASYYEELPVFAGGEVLRAFLPSQTTTTTEAPTTVTTEAPTVETTEAVKTGMPILNIAGRSSPNFSATESITLALVLLLAIPLAL